MALVEEGLLLEDIREHNQDRDIPESLVLRVVKCLYREECQNLDLGIDSE